MAKSKAEKVDITIQSSSSEGKGADQAAQKPAASGKTTSQSTAGAKQSRPATASSKGSAAASPKQTSRNRAAKAETDQEASDDQQTDSHDSAAGSMRQRQGGEATLQPLASDKSEDQPEEPSSYEDHEPDVKAPPTEPTPEGETGKDDSSESTQQEAPAEQSVPDSNTGNEDTVDHHPDFYSSKLDATKPSAAEQPQSSGEHKGTFTSGRFWFLLLIFLMTAAAGFVMLYQLEQVQPGAGIIFDWI